jgi:2'-5' RNA ligase
MRAFVAVDLPDTTADALARVQAMLPAGRPVPRDNLHLTLAFLDDQPQDVLAALHDKLAGIRLQRFDVTFSGLDCLGGDEPAVLVAAVAPNDPLTFLHGAVQSAARRAGIVLRRQRYRPHVTIARLRAGQGMRIGGFLADHAGLALPVLPVTGFVLYQSTLGRGGARHDPLAEYPLTRD